MTASAPGDVRVTDGLFAELIFNVCDSPVRPVLSVARMTMVCAPSASVPVARRSVDEVVVFVNAFPSTDTCVDDIVEGATGVAVNAIVTESRTVVSAEGEVIVTEGAFVTTNEITSEYDAAPLLSVTRRRIVCVPSASDDVFHVWVVPVVVAV
jgi:hypothetical protein